MDFDELKEFIEESGDFAELQKKLLDREPKVEYLNEKRSTLKIIIDEQELVLIASKETGNGYVVHDNEMVGLPSVVIGGELLAAGTPNTRKIIAELRKKYL